MREGGRVRERERGSVRGWVDGGESKEERVRRREDRGGRTEEGERGRRGRIKEKNIEVTSH